MIFFAFLCIFIGVYPQPLYNILPYPVDYHAYTGLHVVRMLQLLFFSGLAFFAMLGLLKRTETITLDTDWFYRKGSKLAIYVFAGISAGIANIFDYLFIRLIPAKLSVFSKRPITTLIGSYGGEYSATDDSKPGALPETANLIPAGVPVLLAVAFVSALAVTFILLS
jgi:multicomponent Na+:H+ antiporter subunit D